MKYSVVGILFFLFSCASVSRNLWLNRFEVCCVVEHSLLRNGDKVEFKEGYFEDEYLKLKAEFDVMEGIKLNFINKCGVNSYINWDEAFYLDESGNSHKVTFSEISSNLKEEENMSILPPFIEIVTNIIPKDYIYRKKDIWMKKTMFDFSFHPQDYLFKKPSLNFYYKCGYLNLKYSLFFYIDKRYPKNTEDTVRVLN